MKTLTRSEFARLKGVNRSTVTRWIESGRVVVDARDRIDPEAAERSLEATESPYPHHGARVEQIEAEKAARGAASAVDAPTAPSAPGNMEHVGLRLKLARAMREEAQAAIAAMDRDEKARLLIQRSDVEFVLADFGRVLGNLLERLADGYTPALAGLAGDTADAEVWEDLDHALALARVQLVGVDAGYQTQLVNAFVEPRGWCIAMKGVGGMNRPLVEDERKRRQRLRQRRRKGAPQEPIGVDSGKAMIYARLRKEKVGPGYIHFPDHAAFDREFFEQLTAEKLVAKVRSGRVQQEWVKLRPRNEALDCAVGALALFHLAGVMRPRPRPNIDPDGETAPGRVASDSNQPTVKTGSWAV